MQLAMIGLGRMGGNMVQRLLQGGHEVVVYDRSADAVKPHVAMGASAAKDLADLSARPSTSCCRRSPRATSSSTAATRTTRTRSAAPPG